MSAFSSDSFGPGTLFGVEIKVKMEAQIAQWLAQWPLVLEVQGFIPQQVMKTPPPPKFMSDHVSLGVVCGDDISTASVPLNRDI